MSNSKLAALKERFKKSNETGGGQGQNNYYPFWNMKEGEQAIVRFLPDANLENPSVFVVEKLMHNLTVNGEKKSIPCMKTYGKEKDCPICKVSSAYYKQDDKVNGKLYWRKKQFIAQVLVIEDPLPADKDTGETHQGKIRYLALGNKIHEAVIESFDDLDDEPWDFKKGTNFIIKKTKSGDYADYARSKFQKNPSALDDETIAHIQSAMIDLSTLLPKQPEIEKVDGMLEAALSGKSFVEGETKSKTPESDTPATVLKSAKDAAKASTSKKVVKDEPKPDSDDNFGDDDAERILEEIRNRKRAAAPVATTSAD